MKTTRIKCAGAEQTLFSVRMPVDMHNALSEVSKKEGCSLNGLIVKILAERLHTISVIGANTEGDPLAAAYQAAEAAEHYAQAAREAIARFKPQK